MSRFTLLILLLAGLLAGCREAPGPRSEVATRPALWVIEDSEGRALGWLFGTIHALPAGTRWETPAVTEAIAAAGVLVVEATDLDPQRVAAALSRSAGDEPVPPLAQRLTPQTARALARIIEEDGRDAKGFDRLETWAVALALARSPSAGTSSASGVDRAMLSRFEGRPVAALEGVERQLAIFDDLAEREQQAMLDGVLAERANPADVQQALTEAWLTGDMAAIDRTARAGLLADRALRDALLTRRNATWIAPIARMVAQGRKPLVAVGAAHMTGPDGLPALLEARGYRIRRVQ